MQPKTGGKLHLKLNTGTRPIANKYREGKMKRTLKKRVKKYVKPLKGKRMELAISPRQIQLLARRDVRALDPHGRDVCGCDVRSAHFWRASVSVGCRRATRTRGRWAGLHGRLLQPRARIARRRPWLGDACLAGDSNDRSGMSTVAGRHACALKTAAGRSDGVHTLRVKDADGHTAPSRPVLKHGPRSLTCARVSG